MKWEYKAIRLINDKLVHGIDLTRLLNEFGQDGWELMFADLEQDCFIFKRPAIALNITADNQRAIAEYFGGKVG